MWPTFQTRCCTHSQTFTTLSQSVADLLQFIDFWWLSANLYSVTSYINFQISNLLSLRAKFGVYTCLQWRPTFDSRSAFGISSSFKPCFAPADWISRKYLSWQLTYGDLLSFDMAALHYSGFCQNWRFTIRLVPVCYSYSLCKIWCICLQCRPRYAKTEFSMGTAAILNLLSDLRLIRWSDSGELFIFSSDLMKISSTLFSSFSTLCCWLGDRKGIRPVKVLPQHLPRAYCWTSLTGVS